MSLHPKVKTGLLVTAFVFASALLNPLGLLRAYELYYYYPLKLKALSLPHFPGAVHTTEDYCHKQLLRCGRPSLSYCFELPNKVDIDPDVCLRQAGLEYSAEFPRPQMISEYVSNPLTKDYKEGCILNDIQNDVISYYYEKMIAAGWNFQFSNYPQEFGSFNKGNYRATLFFEFRPEPEVSYYTNVASTSFIPKWCFTVGYY